MEEIQQDINSFTNFLIHFLKSTKYRNFYGNFVTPIESIFFLEIEKNLTLVKILKIMKISANWVNYVKMLGDRKEFFIQIEFIHTFLTKKDHVISSLLFEAEKKVVYLYISKILKRLSGFFFLEDGEVVQNFVNYSNKINSKYVNLIEYDENLDEIEKNYNLSDSSDWNESNIPSSNLSSPSDWYCDENWNDLNREGYFLSKPSNWFPRGTWKKDYDKDYLLSRHSDFFPSTTTKTTDCYWFKDSTKGSIEHHSFIKNEGEFMNGYGLSSNKDWFLSNEEEMSNFQKENNNRLTLLKDFQREKRKKKLFEGFKVASKIEVPSKRKRETDFFDQNKRAKKEETEVIHHEYAETKEFEESTKGKYFLVKNSCTIS